MSRVLLILLRLALLIVATNALFYCKTPGTKGQQVEIAIPLHPPEQFSTQYYKVISRSGLNLRERPEIDAKRLAVLPYLYTGEILRERSEVVELQRQRGRWLKIQYKNHTGYIFSGFVLLGDSAKHVNEIFDGMQFKFYAWKTQTLDLSKEKVVTRIPWANGWTIVEVEKQDSRDCDYKKSFKNLIFVQESNKKQTTQVKTEQFVEDTRLIDRKIIISDGNHCHCCCKFHDVALHLAKPDGIFSIPFYYGRTKAECGHWFAPQSEARVTPSYFFYHIKEPICMQYYSDHAMTPKEGDILFADEKFLAIEKNGEYRMYNSVPKHLQTEWDNAVLFTK